MLTEPRFNFRKRPVFAVAALGWMIGLPMGSVAAEGEREGDLVVSGQAGNGFNPSLTATTEIWENATGGIGTGSQWLYLLDLSAELDLAALFGGPEGGSVVIQAFHGRNHDGGCFDEHTGGINPSSGLMAGNQARIYNLHYRQTWLDDAVVIKLGQQAADDDFMGSDYAALFMNSSFGAMPSQVATALAESHCGASAFPIYAVAAPGAFVSVKPSDEMFFQVGTYMGSPGEDVSGNRGFDWELSSNAGVAVFYEGGVGYRLGDLAGALKLGGTLHSGKFDDLAAQNNGAVDATVHGFHSFYFVFDQTLIRGCDGDTLMGAFWRSGFSPLRDRSAVRAYYDCGFVWNGPFGRADDATGLAFSHTHLGKEYAWQEDAAQDEKALELTYRTQLTPWLVVQGDVQWLLNPAFSESSGGDDHALVVGLRTEFSF